MKRLLIVVSFLAIFSCQRKVPQPHEPTRTALKATGSELLSFIFSNTKFNENFKTDTVVVLINRMLPQDYRKTASKHYVISFKTEEQIKKEKIKNYLIIEQFSGSDKFLFVACEGSNRGLYMAIIHREDGVLKFTDRVYYADFQHQSGEYSRGKTNVPPPFD